LEYYSACLRCVECSRLHDGHDVFFVAAGRSRRGRRSSRNASVHATEMGASRLFSVVHGRYIMLTGLTRSSTINAIPCFQRHILVNKCKIKLQFIQMLTAT